MILLELIILIIGLLIALLSLTKSESERKNNSKRNLAILYLLLCVFSAVLLIIKSGDTNKSGLKLFNTLHNIEKQSDTLFTLLDSISALKNKMDFIISKTEESIIQREQSQKIFDEQKKLLEKSNELTQKQLEDSKPDVVTYTPDITFAPNDSISTTIKILFRNEGKRVASEFKANYVVAFKNKNGTNYLYKFFSHSNSQQSDIYPMDPTVGLIVTNELAISFDSILKNSTGGVIIIAIRYIDNLFNNILEKKFIFSLKINKEKIEVFKENTIPKELEDDMIQNKINKSNYTIANRLLL